jgi:hypothetical protein
MTKAEAEKILDRVGEEWMLQRSPYIQSLSDEDQENVLEAHFNDLIKTKGENSEIFEALAVIGVEVKAKEFLHKGDEEPVQNDLVRQLTAVVWRAGVEDVAPCLTVSIAALRSWLHGVTPDPENLEKIKRYLSYQPSASDKALLLHDAADEKLSCLYSLLEDACEVNGEDISTVVTNATPMQLEQEFDLWDPLVVGGRPIRFWGKDSVFELDYTPDLGNYLIHVVRHPYESRGKLCGRLSRDFDHQGLVKVDEDSPPIERDIETLETWESVELRSYESSLKRLRPNPEFGWFRDDDRWLLLLGYLINDQFDEDGYVSVLPGTHGKFAIEFLIRAGMSRTIEFDDWKIRTVRNNRDRDRKRIQECLSTAGLIGMKTEEIELALEMPHQTCAAKVEILPRAAGSFKPRGS